MNLKVPHNPPQNRKGKLSCLELEDFPADEPALRGAAEESQDSTMATAESPATPVTDSQADEPKRKRGKRKVLKKTTKRDEKGYLGTCGLFQLVNGDSYEE